MLHIFESRVLLVSAISLLQLSIYLSFYISLLIPQVGYVSLSMDTLRLWVAVLLLLLLFFLPCLCNSRSAMLRRG